MRVESVKSSNIKRLVKWTIIVGGMITIVNIVGLAAFLFANQKLDWRIFMRLLLSYLMLEGVIITLIGCAAFFGFKKYSVWLGEGAEHKLKRKRDVNSPKKIDSEMNFGTFLLILGISLFLISFIVFSFIS